MNFTPFPKTRSAWDQTCFRCYLITGILLLSVQVWARLALSGLMRQHIEETLWPLPLIFGTGLVLGSVIAMSQRRWIYGFILVIGVLSVLVALLPILLQEGVRD